MRVVVVASTVAVALTVAGLATATDPVWSASVGPGYNIALRDAAGNEIANPAPGPVTIEVDDMSAEHNFHLSGPGVNVSTSIEDVGRQTFQATLADGVYRFVCDAHPTRMSGQFTAGTGGGETGGGGGGTGGGTGGGGGGAGGTTKPPSAPVGSTLVLTSGPAVAIGLKTKAGKQVTRLKPGHYTILVRDRSATHNAHLLGAGVNRKTSVPGMGTETWKVVLHKGTLVFRCDAHKGSMRGTVTVAA